MKLHSVEAFLIEPLKAYFEKEPKAGSEAHIVDKLEGTEITVLEGAVDWIKSNRQAQSSFPSPKEVFAAVEAVRAKVMEPKAAASFHDDMTYGEKLKAFMEATKAKQFPVVRKGTAEWTEWEIYFLAMDNKVQYPVMRTRDSWTVPTLLPSQFDPGFDWARGDRLLRERTEFERQAETGDRKEFVRQQLARAGMR